MPNSSDGVSPGSSLMASGSKLILTLILFASVCLDANLILFASLFFFYLFLPAYRLIFNENGAG